MNKPIKIIAVAGMVILNSCSPDCKDDISSYNDGYSSGKLARYANDNPSCNSWANEMSKQGFNIDANSCYCAGFKDGKAGNENKYK